MLAFERDQLKEASVAVDEKYVVLKRDDESLSFDDDGGVYLSSRAVPLDDAVVIRTGDIFASAGLHAYANLVIFCIELANFPADVKKSLEETRDYFMQRAHEAEERFRRRECKYPD